MEFITEKVKQFETSIKKARELLYLSILSEEEEQILDQKIDEIYQDVLEFVIHKHEELDTLINQILNK